MQTFLKNSDKGDNRRFWKKKYCLKFIYKTLIKDV